MQVWYPLLYVLFCRGKASCSLSWAATGVFIANVDVSIILATYSTISSEFESLENASWLVVTYSLAMCAIQPSVCCTTAIKPKNRLKTKR